MSKSQEYKHFKLFNPQVDNSLTQDRNTSGQIKGTNWGKCALCQKKTTESLQCPANNTRTDFGAGYKTVADNLKKLNDIDDLPMPVDIRRLDDGSGIEKTLMKNKAEWHKSCSLKFNNDKTSRAEEAHKRSHSSETQPSKFTRRSVEHNDASGDYKEVCFFCEEELNPRYHHTASTMGIDTNVRKCALELQDSHLMAKLSDGDMVAIDAKYHLNCLSNLYNKHSAFINACGEEKDTMSDSIALAELMSYIDETRLSDDGKAPVYKLKDLDNLYMDRLRQLGVYKTSHSTRLKNRILAHYPDMEAVKSKREVLLSMKKDIGLAVSHQVSEDNYDEDAIILAKASRIVRRDFLAMKTSQSQFNGSLDRDCQKKTIPQSLLALVSMVQYGSNIKNQPKSKVAQSTLSIAQLMISNSYIKTREESIGSRQNRSRETPFLIYVGLYVHAKTRKKKVIDTLHDLGLSIAYDRVMDLETAMANSVTDLYHEHNVVVPANMKKGLFTTAAVDNIDHNCSSATATDSFHGTGISLFQHPSQEDNSENVFDRVMSKNTKMLQPLPDFYINIVPVSCKKVVSPPPKKMAQKPDRGVFVEAVKAEHR